MLCPPKKSPDSVLAISTRHKASLKHFLMPQSQHSGQLVAQEVFIKDTGTGPLGTLDIWFQNKTTFSSWNTVEQTCWNFCSTVMLNKRLRGRWNCQKSSHLVPFMAIQLVDWYMSNRRADDPTSSGFRAQIFGRGSGCFARCLNNSFILSKSFPVGSLQKLPQQPHWLFGQFRWCLLECA